MSAYPPPSENLPIFDSALFGNNSDLTIDNLKSKFLTFPLAQSGLETIPNLAITSSGTAPTPASTSNDTTIATTAFVKANALSPLSPDPTGTYTNLNATINSYGQVISASNGTGGITSFTITSNAVGTNSWSFTIPNSYGRAFSYSIYSDTTPTTYSKSNLGIPPYSYGSITSNGGFIYATGGAVYQPYSGTSSTFVDYCSGGQNIHSVSASGAGYFMSVINAMGGTGTWTITSSSVNNTSTISGATPCPAVATPSSFTTYYTFSTSASCASCYAKLVGVVIAS